MLYTIRSSPLHGLGVFATQDIPHGTIIISESPLLYSSSATGFLQAYFSLSAESRRIYHTLHNKDDDNIDRSIAEGIWATNRFTTPSGDDSAVFEHISRINHSCVPNAMRTWTGARVKGQMEVVAARDIVKGEEVLHPYVAFEGEGLKERRGMLKAWGFVCSCERCANDAELARSEGWKWIFKRSWS